MTSGRTVQEIDRERRRQGWGAPLAHASRSIVSIPTATDPRATTPAHTGPCLFRALLSRGRRALAHLVLFVVFPVAIGVAAPVAARPLSPADNDAQVIDAAAREYRAIDVALTSRTRTAERRILHARALAVQQIVLARTADLQAQLATTEAKLAQLANTPGAPNTSPRIRTERHTLEQQRAPLSLTVQRGRQLATATARLLAETAVRPTDILVEQLSTQIASPLSWAFWQGVTAEAPHDAVRLVLFGNVERDAIAEGGAGFPWSLLLGAAVALTILFPLRIWLRRLGRRVMLDHAPSNRLRKSGQAAWIVFSGTLLPGIAAACFVAGLRGAGMLAPAWEPLALALSRAAAVAGLIGGLGGALLMRNQPQWRLLPIADDTARALRPWTWGAAALAFASVMVDSVRIAAGLGSAMQDASNVAIAAAHILFIALLLVWIGRLRLRAIAKGDAIDDSAGETSTALASLVAWAATIAAAAALLLGYVALGALIGRLLIWLPLVMATFAIALVLADDLSTGLISRRSPLGLSLHRGFGIRASLIDQAGVVLSAFLRLALVLLGLTLATGPFGSNVDTLLDQFTRLAHGVTIGELTISPGAVLQSVAVLVTGLFVARLVQHWLTQRYLPVTDFDAGARNSIATVVGYVGPIIACLWALASLGIGFERIALLLSALSVGIGFGLQAITQNFVSGLILLAERPVKIGDLIRIGDLEGDVRKISVRATEIQIRDRSTLIVPNSELITKTVRNMTLADPVGRVQLKFTVGIDADIDKVRDMLVAMYESSPAVLDEPPPKVFVDSIDDGRITINSFSYVATQRDVYPTKSDLLFRLLVEFPAAGIDLGTAPQQLQILPTASERE